MRLGGGRVAVTLTALALTAPASAVAMGGWSAPFQAAYAHSRDSRPLAAVSCPSAALCLAVDDHGDIVRSTRPAGTGSDWHAVSVEPGALLTGISCPSTHLCVAVDAHGNVLSSRTPLGNPGSWHATPVDTTQFNDIACPAASLCVAVDDAGRAFVSEHPTGGGSNWDLVDIDGGQGLAAISCHGPHFCLAVDGRGNAISSTQPAGGAGAWRVTNIDGTRVLAGITCPSSTLCLAGEARGRVLASQHPLSGAAAWHTTRIDVPSETDRDAETDNSVVPFCASSTLCVAADVLGRLFVSEDPGAAAPHWRNRTPLDTEGNYNAGTCPRPSLCVMVDGNGSAWNTTQPVTGGWHRAETGRFVATALTGKVQCASSSLCLMLTDNGMYATTHPAARHLWQHQPLPFKLAAVACPVRSFCAGIAPAEVHTTTNPLGGRRAWRLTDVDPGNDLTGGINCDSPRLCAAVDGSGDVVTSNNPTGGSRAWRVTRIDSFAVSSAACAGRSLCVAADSSGNLFSSTNPTGGRHAWHKTHLGGHGLHGVSWSGVACPTPTVCLADSGERNKLATLTLAGHTVSWAFSTLPAGLDLADLACPSSALCVAVAGPGDSGQLASNAKPTGGGAWTLTTVDAQPITNVSCPSPRFCAAVDQDGRVITSRRPAG